MRRGGLLIVALTACTAGAQDLIPLPVPSGPPLDIIQAGATLPIIKPNIPPLPPTPGAGVPGPKALPKMPTDLPPAGTVTEPPGGVSPVEGHPIFVPPYHPEPPPATYSTSGCNFNVWCGDEFFSPDFSTVQTLVGGYRGSRSGGGDRFGYAPLTLRSGMMLNSPQDTTAIWRGNWESLGELTAACVTSGDGTFLFGPALGLRYNFVQPNAPLVPYLQAGAGFVIANAAKQDDNDTEDVAGLTKSLSGRLFLGAGVHYLLRDNLFLDVEAGYSHFAGSKAASDMVGVQVGVTYFFRSGGR